MIGKELKRLSRRELVDIIYQMKKNEQELQDEIASLKEQLQEKHMRIAEAGSIAQASVAVTNLMAVAQETADLYLREIAYMKAQAQEECNKMIEDAKQQGNV